MFNLLKKIKARIFIPRARCLKLCKNSVFNKSGLEIGGPSKIFSSKGILPIYSFIKNLDNVNFASETVWEGKIQEGKNIRYDHRHFYDYQYISDATELKNISPDKYDFLLSSHVIEHIANPIKALIKWKSILRDDGILIIIIPHKEGTFDHGRQVTSLSHMIEDYNNKTGEDDLTHLNEILESHDLKRDPEAGSFEKFKARSSKNIENRCLHHHVFNTFSAVQLIDFMKLRILNVEAMLPYHIIIVAKKTQNYDNMKIKNLFINRNF